MNTDPNAHVPRPDITSMASDPNTDLETLRTIAFEYPGLRAAVALNPATYQGLLDWLGQLGDASVNQALYQRATYGPYYPQPTYQQPPYEQPAPTQPSAYEPVTAQPVVEDPAVAEFSQADPTESLPGAVTSEEAEIPVAPSAVSAAEDPAVEVTDPAAQPYSAPTTESEPYFMQVQPAAEATAVYPAATPPASYATAAQPPGAAQPAAYAPATQPPYQPPAQPPASTAASTPREEDNSGQKKLLILGILALIALVLLGLIYYLVSGPGGRVDATPTPPAATTETATTSSESQTEQATATEEATATTTPTPTPSAQVQYPAPAGAIEAQLVISPTGNLICNLTEDDVFCMAKESSGKVGQSCAGSPLVVKAGTETTATACGQTMPGGSTVTLEYGKPATFGNVACMSRYSGVTCWNTVTGNSLAISSAGWQAGSRGEIPEKAFSWNK